MWPIEKVLRFLERKTSYKYRYECTKILNKLEKFGFNAINFVIYSDGDMDELIKIAHNNYKTFINTCIISKISWHRRV